jgi:hypothetical protein
MQNAFGLDHAGSYAAARRPPHGKIFINSLEKISPLGNMP